MGIPLNSLQPAPGAVGSGPTRFRPAGFADYAQIASLEGRYGLNPRNYTDWTRLWLDNPAYQEVKADWPIGWVVEDANQHVVASLANIPLSYELDGRRVLAATGKALVAEPEHRSACLLLLDQLINRTPAELYLNNTVGESSAAVMELFGVPRVPVGVWDSAAFWITQYHG